VKLTVVLLFGAAVGAAVGAALAALAVRGEPASDTRHQRRQQAAAALQAALRASAEDDLPPSARRDKLRSACSEAIEMLGSEPHAAGRLAAALRNDETADSPTADQQRALRAAVAEMAEVLAFRPVMEAKLPRGFPPPTPVDEIEVKEYPVYRMARAERAEGNAFWTLFRHIKENDIAMTAPVQMDYESHSEPDAPEQSMAFLYGSPDLGRPGEAGAVRVMDVEPTSVVSIGVRGSRTPEKLASAHTRLMEWLTANADRYQVAGPMRVMGYNSPFVPASRSYFEVQIPVEGVRAVSQGEESASRFNLADHVWKHRVVLVFAPSPDDAEYAKFLRVWSEQPEQVADRDLVLVSVFENGKGRVGDEPLGADAAAGLRQRLDVATGRTEFVLIGKDGGVKLRRPTLPIAELFATIDAMPMRRAEIGRKRPR